MTETIQAIDLKNPDKSNWETYRFDEIAKNISERVDPNNTDLEIYIGLEHIDAESIHIKRTGTPDDVDGQKLRCYPGDVIFGRRRAYQRKAAIAPADGFCSAHSLVLRANPDVIEPKLFPFFLHSDLFMHRAIDISVGSLSPTINWGTLKHQEFMLPPKYQQAQLAELLWAMDEMVEKDSEVTEKLSYTYSVYVDDLFIQHKPDWQYIPLSKIANINKRSLKSNTDPNYEFQYLDIASILEPKVINNLQKLKFAEAPSRARRIVTDNSIVLSLVRPYHKSFVLIECSNGIIASTGTAVVDIKEKYNTKFVFHQFFSRKFLMFCENRMTGTNYPSITSTDLEQFEVALPNDDLTQIAYVQKLDLLDYSIKKIKNKIIDSKNIQKTIINQIF